MQPATPVLQDDLLVPLARFGAALHRSRARNGASLAALARSSDGQWMPDQLVDIERGLVALDDGEIRSAVDLYGLAARPWAPASTLELVLDRTVISDFSRTAPGDDLSHDDRVRRTAARFAALSVITGIDLTSGPLGLGALAEAIELPLSDTIELLTAVMWEDAPAIGQLIGVMEHRVVVPQAGYLVAETTMGSLLLTARPGCQPSGPVVAACGTFVDLFASLR